MNINLSQLYVILIVVLAAMCGILFGYDTGVIAGALIFIKDAYQLTIFQQELLVALVPFGALLGAMVSGILNDQLGRRSLLFITALIFVIGTLLCSFAANSSMLMTGRFIVGMAVGVSSFSAPLYIAEIAPTMMRGSLVIINTVTVTGGILLAYILDYFLAKSGAWHAMFAIGIIPAMILLFGVFFLPGSPRWLIQNNKDQKAIQVLTKIRRIEEVESEVSEIKQIIKTEKSGSFKPHWSLLTIGIILAAIQQVSGINAILYYAPELIKNIFTHDTSVQLLGTIAIGAVNFLMTIVAMVLVDKIGRRPLLLTGLLSMTVSLFALAMSLKLNFASRLSLEFTLGILLLYIACYAISIGCIFWLIIAEIYPLQIRGKAMGFAAASNWIANLIVSVSALSLISSLGLSVTLLLYAAAGLLSFLFCYYWIPETKNISLEKIELGFRS